MTRQELPGLLIIAAAGNFEPGLAIRGRFGMNQKNNFCYILFFYDHSITLKRETLLERFDQLRSLFPLDYEDPREAFNGQIEVEKLSAAEIRAAIKHYNDHVKVVKFPPGYLQGLKAALRINSKSDCLVAFEVLY